MKTLRFLLLATLLTGCIPAKNQGSGTVLAKFEGQTITEQQFTQKAKTLPKEFQSFIISHKREFLDDMISEYYLLKEAKRQRLEEQSDVKSVLEAAHRKILIAKVIENDVDQKISLAPGESEKYYEDHREEFMTPLTFRASHILVKTEEEAREIRVALDGGADFEELARSKSLDATAIRGGDLGFFQKGQFIPEFENIILGMKKGETTGPAQTPYGYHVVRLTDRLEPSLRDFKSVRPLVDQRILNEKRARSFKTFVQKLKGGANIQVDEKALDAVNLS